MRRLLKFLVHWLLLIGPHPTGVLCAGSDGIGGSAGDSATLGKPRQSSLFGFFTKVINDKPTEENKHPKQQHIPDGDLVGRVDPNNPNSNRVVTVKTRKHSSVRTSLAPSGRPRGRPRTVFLRP